MTATVVYIRKPSHTFHSDKLSPILINSPPCRIQGVFIWYFKFPITAMNRISHPHSIFFYQRESFFVCYSIHISYNNELFIS